MNNLLAGEFSLSSEERESVGTRYENVKVEIRYELGGYGGIDWSFRKRGYQLSVTPYAAKNGMQEYVILGGYGAGGFVFLEEAKRKSAKRMKEIADSVSISEVKAAFLSRNVEGMKKAVKAL